MKQINYVVNQLSKTFDKKFENYVVTRIYHSLDRNDVKFVTQQYVIREEGYALTDLYFPQLDLHIEVDEDHHNKAKNIEKDKIREYEIVERTEHKVVRIKITEDIYEINKQIDDVVNLIKSKIDKLISLGKWKAWSFERELNPNFWKEKGYLLVSENPFFKTKADILNCLGETTNDGEPYKTLQQGSVKSGQYPNHYVWFPNLDKKEDYVNEISNDGKTIVSKRSKEKYDMFFEKLDKNCLKRIVFPKTKNNLGEDFYRFRGIFELDLEKSSYENGIVYNLISEKIELK